MDNIAIHRVDVENCDRFIPGIVHVFRDDEVVPWHRHGGCVAWVARRAERGLYIAAACDGDQVVGYSEWNETYDSGRQLLYLSIMQVDCGLRGRGIGTAMLADGEAYAKHVGATHLRTVPEDERAHAFYRKYGFADTDDIFYCVCPTTANCIEVPAKEPVNLTVDMVNTHAFVFGLCQSSGSFMYQVANHDPEISGYTAVTAGHPDGYLQFRYKKGAKKALALYWSNAAVTAGTIASILARGRRSGFEEVEFYFRSKYKGLFAGHPLIRESIEIERSI